MVSVIIPTYNRRNTIIKSVESVKKSSYRDIEIIIVDDASTDDTEVILKDILCENIRYIKNEKNMGIAATRNVGIKYAKGDYIAFNDSDDYWRATKLEKQMKLFEEDSELSMVYCAFERVFLDGKKERIPSVNENIEGYIYDCLLKRNVISTQTMLFKKECFEAVGYFNTEIKTIDDYDMALRVAKNKKIGYIDEVLVDVVMSVDSVTDSVSNYIKQMEDYCLLLNNHYIPANYRKYKGFTSTIIRLSSYLNNDELKYIKQKLQPISNCKNIKKMFSIRMVEMHLDIKQKKRAKKLICSKKIDYFIVDYYLIQTYIYFWMIKVRNYIRRKIK